MRILSLGAGVQSSTVALLIASGEIAPVDAAIFSDTQWEPRGVYDWLDWLDAEIQRSPNPFPIHRVTAGNIREGILAKQNATGQRFASVPWFVRSPDGTMGMVRRQCTYEYKLAPLTREKRRLLGYAPRQRIPVGSCETLIGISLDEAIRAKESMERWNTNVFPLLDLRMTRQDCLRWMESKGYPRPPKSSCIGCPFHSDAQWREIKADPEAWSDVVQIDRAIRKPVGKMRGEQFMHRSATPLEDVDFSTPEERGQGTLFGEDGFGNECEGMCGV
jgi:hypothetical protein